MKPGRYRRTLTAIRQLLGILLLFGGAGTALAAIELIYFTGSTETDRIRLDWETATELDNAGYKVLRSETSASNLSQFTPIPVIDATSGVSYDFIPARGDDLIGALYSFFDEEVIIGTRYYYFLEDIDTSNLSSFHGPVEVVAGQTSTPTPAATPTSTPVTPSGPTPTPTQTSPPQTSAPPTSTDQPTASPTQEPAQTSTPVPTAGTPVSSFDKTLTAVYASVTEIPSETASAGSGLTATPTPAAAAALPQATRINPTSAPDTSTSPGDQDAGPGILSGRLLPALLVLLASGGLLTAGVILLARRSRSSGAGE